MQTERISRLRDVQAHARCPECGAFIYDRSNVKEEVEGGNPLYTFTESCHNCGWSYTVENVELGV